MFFKLALKDIRRTIDKIPIFIMSVIFAITVAYAFFTIGLDNSIAEQFFAKTSVQVFSNLFPSFFFLFIFVAIFLGLFILYSNNFFMKQRQRDISILILAGFSRTQISLYFMFQQLIIGLVMLSLGLVFGIIFVRLIFMFLLKLMALDYNPGLTISGVSILSVCFVFLIILVLVWLNTSYQVSQTKIDFNQAKANKLVSGQPRRLVSRFLGYTSFLILIFDILAVFWVSYNQSVISSLENTIISLMTIIGGPLAVYGLFKWFFPNLIIDIKKKANLSDKQLIWLSNLRNSFKQSSFILTVITIISILALLIFLILSAAYPYRQEEVQINSPTELAVNVQVANQVENLAQKSDITLSSNHYVSAKVIDTKTSYITFISQRDYNEFWEIQGNSEEKLDLGPNDAWVVSDNQFSGGDLTKSSQFLQKGAEKQNIPKLEVIGHNRLFPMGRIMYISDVVVVNNQIFKQIQADYKYGLKSYDYNQKYLSKEQQQRFEQSMEDWTNSNSNNLTVGRSNNQIVVSTQNFGTDNEMMTLINFAVPANEAFKQIVGFGVFILLFLAILFILSSGNLLMLQLRKNIVLNFNDFKTYRKLGATKQDLLSILKKQTAFYFFAPLTLALIAVVSFLPFLSVLFNSIAYLTFGAVLIVYFLFNIIFYFVVYRDFSSLLYSSVLERQVK